MNFVSWSQFHADIAAWERLLPEFDAVCGVPRSGLVPAAYIALRRNIRLVDLSDLMRRPEGVIRRATLRDSNPIVKNRKPYGNKLLIVDDSSSPRSFTFNDLREKLKDQTSLSISYGAVYRASETSQLDFYFKEIPLPRIFGWNWCRHFHMKTALVDMDGVLCEDWKHRPEMNDDPEFVQHIDTVNPLYLPDWPIMGIVTSRIERYRPQTEAWLRKHGVHYNRLIMHPAPTPELRRQANDHAERKALVYRKAKDASLFVESDVRQAKEIFRLTQRPVLCTDTMTMFSKKTNDN
jgi:uncharacterized HAD superfamily protein